jgi:hypothetical protein
MTRFNEAEAHAPRMHDVPNPPDPSILAPTVWPSRKTRFVSFGVGFLW